LALTFIQQAEHDELRKRLADLERQLAESLSKYVCGTEIVIFEFFFLNAVFCVVSAIHYMVRVVWSHSRSLTYQY
jgi:hypothetical protein